MRRCPIPYSDDEMAWLEANRMMVIGDYHAAFVAAFDRRDVTAAHLHGLRKRKGWKVGRAPGRLAGRHRRYSPAEIAWLQQNATLPIADYHARFIAEFGRDDVSPAQLISLRKRKGWKTGRTGRFAKGQEPMNKGRRCPPGVGGRHPNARATQFRKGQLPHNHRGAGHERIDAADGYVVMIVDEPNPWTGAGTRPVHKHRWLWEQANGPVPEGFCLKCLDGDKTNTDPANWELIERGLLPHLNGGRRKTRLAYDDAAPEIKPALMAVAKIKHKAKARRSQAAERTKA